MSPSWHFDCGYVLAAAATIYTVLAWIAVRFTRGAAETTRVFCPAVTVLKPLCGAEYELYESLRSF